MSLPPKQVILAAHFPGVNNRTVWSDPRSGSQIAIESFLHLAATAERAKFDFFFLAEGLRLREQAGRIYDLDVVGRPDTLAILAALAGVTQHLGLIGTLNATYHEAFELARQLATLDHLSGGRAGWNVVTSSDAFTGENFRRGGYLDYARRYERAGELVQVARQLWRSWSDDDLVADPGAGFYAPATAGAFAHHGDQFAIEGRFTVPRSPQVDPVILQAGDSDGGRELGATIADGIFTGLRPLPAAQAFTAELRARAAARGRRPGDLKILPAAAYVLGDTDDEARDNEIEIRRAQVSGATAIATLERVWNRDLSAYDPDGPLPDVDPDVSTERLSQGRANWSRDPVTQVKEWREQADANGWSIRDLVMANNSRHLFVGTPERVAADMDEYVQTDGCDGFILVPHLTPAGLDDFADRVVPLLQERGVFRTEYTGETLRDNLGLPPALPESGELSDLAPGYAGAS